MKLRIIISLSALFVLLPLVAQAQQNLLFQVEVPFGFIAGGTHLPAGQYLVFHTTTSLLQMVREDGRAAAYIPVKASPVMSGDTRAMITFNRYGNSYFLANVSTAHDQQVHECDKCRAEKTLMARFAKKDVTTVALEASPDR